MRKIGNVVARLGIGALLLIASGVFGLRLSGTATYAVMSGSMTPTLPVGSLALVRPTDPANVRVGDIITFELPDRVVTHRVIAIDDSAEGRTFTTKGDANPVEDPERLTFQRSVGSVETTIPALGYVVVYGQAYWRLAAMLVAATVFLGAAALLLLGRDGANTPQPVRVARARTKRAARRVAVASDELWTAHLTWMGGRHEVAA